SNNAFPKGYLVSAIFPLGGDSTFLATITSGFYILTSKKLTPFGFKGEDPFIHQRILTAIPVTKDWLAIGTNLKGCYIVSKDGEIIENLSRKEGLQINNILYLFVDNDKNLWLGLDNGIDFVAFNNEIKHIYPERFNEGEGYTAQVFKNTLYIGTSNGLYQIPIRSNLGDLSFDTGSFKTVPNTSGSSWGLSVVNDKLLFGHHDGAFQIVGGKAIPISNAAGYYNFLPYYDILPSSLIIGGTSIGLDLLKYSHDRFTSMEFLPGFNEFSQFIAIDNTQTVWVAHPYGGVFKLDISDLAHPRTKLYNQESGLPSSYNNHLFKVRNRVVVATEKGIYEYNSKIDRFGLSPYFKNIFGTRNIRFLKEDSIGNIWFIEDKSLGVVDYATGKPQVLYFPELDGKMGTTFDFIYPYNQQNIFVGAEKGFYHINFEKYKKKYANNLSVRVTSVKAFGASDSLFFGGYFGQVNQEVSQTKATTPRIGSGWNSLHFEFSSPLYEHENSLLYSYFLKGFDDKWSSWTKRTEKDDTNLSGGKYTFMVKVKNNLGSESEVTSYNLVVLPPWYETTLAYIIYVILFITFNYVFFRKLKQVFVRQRKKHEEQQKHLQYLHQLELEKSEKEIVALRNEKLRAELRNKKTELASTSMHLIQKGDLLSKVKEELSRIRKTSTGEIASDDFKKLIRALKEEDHLDDDWQLFETHFDSVNYGFIRSLKQKFPTLTPNELKLCAYLHMNLSSKEIAQHMKISVRGVEISRYRLRKKLRIPKETNLFDFLLEVTSSDANQD
ncbi:MAG: transcriptional regulator, partial [Bacteroidota bacterium]|nr:transcriptional regulator [Bacteroidota bacterium]